MNKRRFFLVASGLVACLGSHIVDGRVKSASADDSVPAGQDEKGSADAGHVLLPLLPEASSSLGAVVSEGFLYVYGGHIAPVHTYSTDTASGRFHRLAIEDAPAKRAAWEKLASGPRLQGMNLAAHRGQIYRVGGMESRNAPGEDADNVSVATVARFDPATASWTNLPPLPQPRSSHDVVSLGAKLYVVGGWNMLGADDGEEWCDTMEVLNLAAPAPAWQSIPQPFTRRALIAAAFKHRLWVIGGFTDDEEVSRQVDIFDPAQGTWGRGPDLPAGGVNGFAPAACVFDGRLLVSVADGSLLELDEQAGAWTKVAHASPRIVHRMVPAPNGVILVGGASGKDSLDRVELVKLR